MADSRTAEARAAGGTDADSKEEASRVEQRTLTLSIYGVVLMAVGSVAYGLYLESDIVIVNGIFSVLSFVAGGLRLFAAKLIVRPEDERFPYGYSHVEPLVHTVNGFLVLVICVYSFIAGDPPRWPRGRCGGRNLVQHRERRALPRFRGLRARAGAEDRL